MISEHHQGGQIQDDKNQCNNLQCNKSTILKKKKTKNNGDGAASLLGPLNVFVSDP